MHSNIYVVVVLAVLLDVLLLQTTGVRANGCPSGCTCNQRTLRCIRKELTSVPQIPADTVMIDLRFNNIRNIDRDSFTGLHQVHTIFLNDNHLSSVAANVFGDLSSLKYLYLNRNRIAKIDPGAFNGLPRLHNLYLNSNDIYDLEPGTFAKLGDLERLHLQENKISHISENVFEGLSVLKDLRLDQNNIKCDCTLLGLLKWLKSVKSLKYSATCHSPNELFGRDVHRLSEHELKCMTPTITEEPISITVNTGETAMLTCRATGHPKPDISWQLNGRPLPAHDSRFHVLSDGSLRISNVDPSCTGQYECRANNSVGMVKSRPARMAIHDSLSIISGAERLTSQLPIIEVRPEGGTILSTHPLILHCVAKGIPEPEISWYLNGRPVTTQSTAARFVHENGTLVVAAPDMEDSGEYMCEATNYLGTKSARTVVTVHVPPTIILAPESRSYKVGDHATLECDADGFPAPRISWLRNGHSIEETNRINFEVENAELHVQPIKESDSGEYICLAENEVGTAEASADIVVDSDQQSRPPQFIIEPYDIDALPGTTIEIPCQVDGDPPPQIKWKKDGRTIYASTKYRISTSGSLQIKKVVALDAGRYECSAINVNGRQTGSGVLTIQTNDILLPGDKYIHIAYKEASDEIDRAINQTVASLFGAGPSVAQRHRELFKVFRYPNGQTRELARAAEIYERTLVNIRKHVDSGSHIKGNLSQFDYKDIISPEHLSLVAELSGCQAHRVIPNCTNMCYHLKYRSIDGTCNNLQHSSWGASLTGFRRVLPPIYENGFSTPIGWNKGQLYHGFVKPSARLVSTEVISTEVITQDDEITHMVMQWGQFLDHDLDHAIPSVSSESWDGIDCKKSCEYAAPCYPIEVPPNDPRVKNRRCIDLVRSSAICGSGMTSVFYDAMQPREQINQLTAYIDASQVYGYTTQFSRDLRNLTTEDGLLRVGVSFPKQKALLPFAAPTDGIDCRRNVEESNINCFVAGDIRVNEQIGLAAMHTLWMREHNRLATELKRLNQHWDGETVYQEARKIVGAQMQHITYKQWLPNVLGPVGMSILGEYKGYDPSINPSISNEFATAALRFGHTLINPLLHRLNESFQEIPQGHLPLRNAFFAPWRLVLEGGVDPLLRGMFSVPAKLKMPTENLNRELTEKLFFTSHAVALDLAAINIQRARDHAIPGYNEFRRVCNLSVADTFDDLRNEISNDEVRAKLKDLYGHPGNIDLFVGGILEDQKDGARVGPLFRCLLIEQFRRIRDGDRLWYENAATFTPEKLSQIKTASLAAVLCNNGDNITRITDNVFHLPETQGGYKQCSEIPQINLGVWLNCDKCSAHQDPNSASRFDPNHPPRFDPNLPPSLVTRQRRSLARQTKTSKLTTTSTPPSVDDETFIEMNEERIAGLESMIETFQHTLKQMRKRLAKVEASCGSNAIEVPAMKVAKGSGHCVDELGQTRLKDEVWTQDECTECHCKQRHQINCTTQKCAETITCSGNVSPVKMAGQCCATCPIEA